MKKQSTTLFTSIQQAGLANLVEETKETLATFMMLPASRIFTASDLWNIHRQGKSFVTRRFIR